MNDTPANTYGWYAADVPGPVGQETPRVVDPGIGDGGYLLGKAEPAVLPLDMVLSIACRSLDRGADEMQVWHWLARRYVDATEAKS